MNRGEDPGLLPTIETTKCKICNISAKVFREHLRRCHKITVAEYEELFNKLLATMERKPEIQAKNVLIPWARKMYKAEKKSEGGEIKEGDEEKKKEDEKSEDAKKDGEKTDTEEKKEPELEEDEDFIEPLQFLVKYKSWDHNDADYYINKLILNL